MTLNEPLVFIGIKLYDTKGCVTHIDRLISKAVYDSVEQTMNEKEELFKKFFNQAYQLSTTVDKMSIEELIKWENELEIIALEARAKQQGSAKGRKERESNLTKEEREKLITQPALGISDALSSVKKRKEKMSKMDKLIETLREAKVPEEEIAKITGRVKVSERPTSEQLPTEFNQLVDRRPPEVIKPNSVNTQESLLAEVSTSLLEKLLVKDDDGIREKANLAGHLAFKVKPELREDTVTVNDNLTIPVKPQAWNPFGK